MCEAKPRKKKGEMLRGKRKKKQKKYKGKTNSYKPIPQC
jgi:hypothetical protein